MSPDDLPIILHRLMSVPRQVRPRVLASVFPGLWRHHQAGDEEATAVLAVLLGLLDHFVLRPQGEPDDAPC